MAALRREAADIERRVAPVLDAQARLSELREFLEVLPRGEEHLLGPELDSLEADAARLTPGEDPDPDDARDAYVTIKAGNGGHEACAWVLMLLRMYERYARRKGLGVELLSLEPYEGDAARSVSVRLSGPGAYGLLRPEQGVHRLSRVSPYDQADRRHTSHASVEVEPEADHVTLGEDEVEVRESDVRVTTCRGGGKGGQAINKTECVAVVRHHETGVVVRCQATRSQAKNREIAMGMLKAKLARLRRAQAEAEAAEKRKSAPRADFGHRSRSYVLSQNPLVHDHRTGVKVKDVAAVMDGDLDMLRG